jgi:phosphoglycolate phosphatase
LKKKIFFSGVIQTVDCKSIIFDLDGTLWDATSLCARAWNEILQEESLEREPFTSADVSAISGKPSSEIAAVVLADYSPQEQNRLMALMYVREDYVLEREGAVALYPGVVEGLHELVKKFPLAIVSNCESSYLEAFFKSTGLKDLFIDNETHGNTGLPKAENISMLCERSQLKSPIYVGDTLWDWEAAQKADLPFVLADYGFGSSNMSQTLSCAAVLSNFQDLLSLV